MSDLHLSGLEKPTSETAKVVSFYCPEQVLEELDAAIERIGKTNRSRIIVLALKRYLPMMLRNNPKNDIKDVRRMGRIKTLRSL